MRDMIFISHANPEDDEFTQWLALQLAKEGYPVWCDLTKLLGGEDFWKDIEQAIRERTCKFIYILSRTSNRKQGPLQELQVAQNVARDLNLNDFVIPLLIDDLAPRDINIQLSRINAIPCKIAWAKGLKLLIDKLEKEGIQKSPKFNHASVTSWWRNQFSAESGVIDQPDSYLSNWYQIESLPAELYFHELQRSSIGKIEVPSDLPFPAFQNGLNLVSFAPAEDFTDQLGVNLSIRYSYALSVDTFLAKGLPNLKIDKKMARDFVYRLLRLAWEGFIRMHALPIYDLANENKCFYFKKDMIKNDEVSFIGAEGNKARRQVVGYKTIRKIKRYWHFGLSVKPLVYPALAYIIKPHVLFSDDGSTIWESKKRLHAARRGQCKDWWNADWRDRILAAMEWLASHEEGIYLRLGNNRRVRVRNHPILFDSPVSYLSPEHAITEVIDYEADLEDDEDLGD